MHNIYIYISIIHDYNDDYNLDFNHHLKHDIIYYALRMIKYIIINWYFKILQNVETVHNICAPITLP